MSELTYQEKLAAQVVKGNEVFIADTARVLGQITLERQCIYLVWCSFAWR
jgi:carbonic anhydrase/acetyltransferase-like protein (isoleucine patch superfamily)